tara:strand:+ start:10 stop:867 length:858 start_codon:yes stop_codon:yes gene_type:complete
MAGVSNNLEFLKVINFPSSEAEAQLWSVFETGSGVYNNTFPSHIYMEVVVQDQLPQPYSPNNGFMACRAENINIGGTNFLTQNNQAWQINDVNSQGEGLIDLIKSSKNFGVESTLDPGYNFNGNAAIGHFTPRNDHQLTQSLNVAGILGNNNAGIIFRGPAVPQFLNASTVNDAGVINDYATRTMWQYVNRVMVFNTSPQLTSITNLQTPTFQGVPGQATGIYNSGTTGLDFFQINQIQATPPQNKVGVVVEMRPDFILTGTPDTNPDCWNVKIDLDGYARWIPY